MASKMLNAITRLGSLDVINHYNGGSEMKKLLLSLCAVTLILGITGTSNAFFIDFEDGVEGGYVDNITGVSFEDFNGYAPIYSDSRMGYYNATSDDLGYSYGTGAYHHNGNMSIWAGPEADARGVIVDFTKNDGTWFTTGYSAYSDFSVEAYLTDGSMVSVVGSYNLFSPMGYLTVTATSGLFIDYVVLHDVGNYWIVDDMSGDASGVNAPVPEPATSLLLSAGLLGLGGFRRKRLGKKS